MGNVRWSTGTLLNLLSRARSATYSSAATGFAGANAVDGVVGKPWILSAGAVGGSAEFDLVPNLIGDFESWTGTVPNGAAVTVTGTGATADDAVNFVAPGAHSAKCIGGASGLASIYWFDDVAAGEETRFIAQLRITAGAGTARVRYQCVETGRFLAPSGLWQDAAIDCFTSSVSGAWDSKALTASMESFALTGEDRLHLLTTVYTTDNCSANFDAVHHWPTWDVASIHGHRFDASQALAIYGGDTSPAATLVATITKPAARPACYIRATAKQTYRFFKIVFPLQNVNQMFAGELVLWQSRIPSLGWTGLERTWTPFQIRNETKTGSLPAPVRLAPPRRRLNLSFKGTTAAIYAEIAGELWFRTLEGKLAIVAIRDDDEPEVLYGRVAAEPHSFKQEAQVEPVDFVIPILEDGLPSVAA